MLFIVDSVHLATLRSCVLGSLSHATAYVGDDNLCAGMSGRVLFLIIDCGRIMNVGRGVERMSPGTFMIIASTCSTFNRN